MILAVDIGNTHMSLGCLDGDDHVVSRFQMSTDRNETAHEYAAELRQILSLEGIEPAAFDGAVISSVVPGVVKTVSAAVWILTKKEPLVLGSGAKVDLELDMNGLTADDIAGDLLATAVAAKVEYPLPAVILDVGTATTVTVVNADGVYIGGSILPGPTTALQGMVAHTSLLPMVDYTAPDRVIAKDTINAMRSGILFGSAGALDGIIDRYAEELGEEPTVLATGGLGKVIAPYCRHEIVIDDHLLLKGLGLIWEQNQ